MSQILLTHTQSHDESLRLYFLNQGLFLKHYPLLKIKYNSYQGLQNFDTLICSSPTSIYWLSKNSLSAQYFISPGESTAKLIKKHRANALFPQKEESMSALLHEFPEQLKKNKVAWIGSHLGALEYSPILYNLYPHIQIIVSHWNWPRPIEEKQMLEELEKSSWIVCSSQYAVLALNPYMSSLKSQVIFSSKIKFEILITLFNIIFNNW
jgi:uroporphyrinogen-III synthase